VSTPRFPVVLVDLSEEEADEASSELFDLGATGIEIRDSTTLVKASGEGETIVASFADEETARAALARFPRAWNPRLETIVGDEWLDEYKKYFHPFELCRGVVVRPPWEAYEKKGGEAVLTLEPGRAFGTGLHETTSLVADVLAQHASLLGGRTVLDVGTGSGILALVALALGAERVRAVDIDPDAVDVACENARRNGLSSRLEVSTALLAQIDDEYPVIVANIEATVLASMAVDLGRRARAGALLVLSGILAPPSAQVTELLGVYGAFEHVETKTKGEWAALVLRAPGKSSS
jgi:ribosomal protein L11 methyltransferase